MVTAKLPKDLIVQKIKSTSASYDLSPDALITLNNLKVPKDIIKLMMDNPEGSDTPKPVAPPPAVAASSSAPPLSASPPSETSGRQASATRAPAPPPPPPPPPAVRKPKPLLASIPSAEGIYLRAGGMPLTPLEPATLSGSKTANGLGAALSGGLSKAKIKGVINGPQAAIRTTDASAEFYFVFGHSAGASLGQSGQAASATLTSPNEFTLMHLDQKSSRREVTMAMVGAYTESSGTDDKQVVAFTFTRVRAGVYRVVPRGPLAPGEYAFFPATVGGQGTAGAGAVQFYDFGVDP